MTQDINKVKDFQSLANFLKTKEQEISKLRIPIRKKKVDKVSQELQKELETIMKAFHAKYPCLDWLKFGVKEDIEIIFKELSTKIERVRNESEFRFTIDDKAYIRMLAHYEKSSVDSVCFEIYRLSDDKQEFCFCSNKRFPLNCLRETIDTDSGNVLLTFAKFIKESQLIDSIPF